MVCLQYVVLRLQTTDGKLDISTVLLPLCVQKCDTRWKGDICWLSQKGGEKGIYQLTFWRG